MAAGLTPGHRPPRGFSCREPFAAILAAGLALVVVAGCASGTPGGRAPTYPPEGVSPPPATGRTDAARGTVVTALGAAGLQATDPDQPYRPAEDAWFAAAPRTVLEVKVPSDASPRFVVLYAFDSAGDAATAAADQASYVTRGAGAVQFPSDSRFTIRTLGQVDVFFTWSPSNADPKVMTIETALDGVGTEVPIPH